jgi:glycosyltransferase involved in cell wall biosynthesis
MLTDHVEEGDSLPEGYSFPFIALLVREFLRRGHHVTVFALDPQTTSARVFRGPRLTIHIGRFRRRRRARDFFRTERKDLVAAMRSSDCEIIHAHWTYEFAMAAIDSGRPHLVTAHDAPLTILRFMRTPYRLVRFLMALDVIRRAHSMSAVSPYVAEHVQNLGRGGRRVCVIPNGIPREIFETPGGRPLDVSERPFTFAAVLTGWSALKNTKAAIRAFALFRRSFAAPSRMIMFGAGHGPGEDAERWAQCNDLNAGIEFRGTTTHQQLLGFLRQNVDVLVHPSLEEAHPMTICEAMAVGVPVIGGKASGGVPFALDGGNAGVLVDVQSPEAISRAMIELANHPHLRAQLSAAALDSARSRFRLENVAAQYEAAYDTALRRLCATVARSDLRRAC